jgi:hypothetical protein
MVHNNLVLEEETHSAMVKMNGRFYGGKQISCEPVDIKSWKSAICGKCFLVCVCGKWGFGWENPRIIYAKYNNISGSLEYGMYYFFQFLHCRLCKILDLIDSVAGSAIVSCFNLHFDISRFKIVEMKATESMRSKILHSLQWRN